MLKLLQQRLQTAFLQPVDEELMASSLLPSKALSMSQCLAIYRHNMEASLLRVLKDHYPVCLKLIGHKAFLLLAKQYIAAYPSRYTDLNNYGASLAEFMQTLFFIEQVAYLPDIARLEWSCHCSLQAVDRLSLDWHKLAGLANETHERLVFELAASVNLLSSDYPIHRIWMVNQPNYSGPEMVNLDEGGVRLIVWQHQDKLCLKPLDELTWQVLVAISQRASLGEIFTRLPVQEKLPYLLPEFIKQGWLVNFSVAVGNST